MNHGNIAVGFFLVINDNYIVTCRNNNRICIRIADCLILIAKLRQRLVYLFRSNIYRFVFNCCSGMGQERFFRALNPVFNGVGVDILGGVDCRIGRIACNRWQVFRGVIHITIIIRIPANERIHRVWVGGYSNFRGNQRIVVIDRIFDDIAIPVRALQRSVCAGLKGHRIRN